MAKMRLRKKATPVFNPFNPKDRAKVEGKIFSDEWVKHNAWMGEENKKSMTKTEQLKKQLEYHQLVDACPTKIRMPTFEEWLENPEVMVKFVANQPAFDPFHPPLFFNYQDGIPVPKLRKMKTKYEEWKVEQDEKFAIFNEMLGEKAIRAGRPGVGEAHKGWGRSKRKY